MKDKKKLLITVLSIVVAVALAVVIVLVAVGKKNPGDDSSSSSSDSSSGGGSQTEAWVNGKFYLASGDGTISVAELELKDDGTYTLKLNATSESGNYTLDGSRIKLKVDGADKYTATYNEDSVVLDYDGGKYTLIKDETYTVTFRNAENFMPNGVKVRNGQKLVLDGKPEKDGYRFLAWFKDEDCTSLFAWSTKISGDLTLYAKFVSADEEYTLTYFDKGEQSGTGTTSGKAAVGLLDGKDDNFIGWWMSDSESANELSRQVKEGTVLNADTKLYAVYQEDKKLTVSVEGDTIVWSAIDNTKYSNINYTVEFDGKKESAAGRTSATFTEIGGEEWTTLLAAPGRHSVKIAAVGFSKADGSRVTYEGSANFYTKRLAKPSNLKVENLMFMFGEVAVDDDKLQVEYKVEIDFGGKTEVKTLTETLLDLREYAMPENSVKFTVYATCEGYEDSLSNTYEYEPEQLAAVTGLTYDAASRKVKWNAVENAESYMVTVTSEKGTQTYVADSAEFDVKAHGIFGEFDVSVYATAGGYRNSAASGAKYDRADTPEVQNVSYRYDGMSEKLSWNGVKGASGYVLTAQGKDKNGNVVGTTHTFDINGTATEFNVLGKIDDLDDADYVIFSITAKGADGKESDAVEYKVLGQKTTLELGDDDFTYSNGTLSWTPVRQVSEYRLTLPNKGTVVVRGTSYEDIVLDSTRNEMTLSYTSDNGAMTAGYEVRAYMITLVTGNSALSTIMYAAEGDTLVLPKGKSAPSKPGYKFNGWYDQDTGAEYGEILTIKGDLSVYAKWENAQYKLTFSVGENGKELPDDNNEATITYLTKNVTTKNGGAKLPVPEVGDDTSKLFLGWYTAPGGAADKRISDQHGALTSTYKFTFDSVLYAYWVTAFEFEPNKTTTDELTGFETTVSYKVKKGPDIDKFDKEEVTVPATYNGKPVDYIEGNAFLNCKFKTINLPNSIYTIEVLSSDIASAFSGCGNLEAVNVYETESISQNIRYFSDGGVLYFENEDVVTEYNKTEVAFVPRKLTGTITIPDTVEIIPGYVMGSGSDGENYNWHYFTGVVIPWSVREIHENAFLSSNKIVTVVFGDTPADKKDKEQPLNISPLAFAKCTSLAELALPARLENFDASIVDGCIKLLAVYIDNGNKNYSAKDGVVFNKAQTELLYFPRGIAYDESVPGSGEYVVPEGVKKIASNAFSGSKIKKVTIASTVSEIAPYAFSGVNTDDGKAYSGELEGFYKGAACTQLEEIVFAKPANDKESTPLTIGEGAFYGSSSCVMTSLTLPRNLYKLGAFAFANRSKLVNVAIEADENYLGGNALDYDVTAFASSYSVSTPYVKNVKLATTVPVINNLAGMIGSSNLESIDVTGNPNYQFDDQVLYDNAKTKILYFLEARKGAYEVPETVTRIEAGTFRGKKYLTEITIPSTVEYVGDEAFKNCSGLERVTILNNKEGEAVTELNLGDDVFMNCSKLAEIELPERTRKIGSGLFKGVKTLAEIVIPEGVTELGDEAFSMSEYGDNDVLKKITLPSTLKKFGTYETDSNGNEVLASLNAFLNCNALEEIVVGEGNENFKSFDGLFYATIFDPAFGCKVDQLVVCVAGATGDENNAVTVRENVTKVWANAFRNNDKIKAINFASANEATMPEEMKGKFKLEIGENAFLGCKKLESIELPVGLTEILSKTFSNCDTLKKVVIPYTVTLITGGTYGSTTRYGAFYQCQALETIEFMKTPDDKTPVPLEITSGKYEHEENSSREYFYNAFESCPALTNIEFPERMTYLGDYTFANSNIKTVVLPSTLKSVGYGVFYKAKNLESVTFGTNEGKSELTSIGSSMFESSTIKSIDIPEGVEAIEYKAFASCYNLTSVKIPSTVKFIGQEGYTSGEYVSGTRKKAAGYAFNGDKNLTHLTFGNDSQLETIENNSFSRTGITKIDLPATIKKIDDYAFEGSKLASISFDTKAAKEGETPVSALKSVGKFAFQNTKLTAVAFPETAEVLTLGNNLFAACTDLTEVSLPSTVESINGVFDSCKSNYTLSIAEENKNIKLHKDDNALIVGEIKTTNDEGEEVIYYSVQFAYKQITSKDGGFTEYKLPSDVVEIRENAFQSQLSITKVTIPAGVSSIGAGAFSNCSFLQEVVFEYTEEGLNKLTTLGKSGNSVGVFENCYSLSKIVLPNNSINADEGIESSNSRIYAKTFKKCLSIEKVGVTPALDEIKNLDGGVYLPNNLMVLGEKPEGTSNSNAGVFEACYYLKAITLPTSLKSIGNATFSQCFALDTVSYVGAPDEEGNALPDSVEVLGGFMFKDTTSLKTVKLPKNGKLETIPVSMFENGGLESITIPRSVKYMGVKYSTYYNGSAFKNCYNLTKVDFETETDAEGNKIVYNNVQLFGKNTFEGTAITEMDLSGATYFDSSLFLNCTKLTSVKFNDKLDSLGNYMFSGCTSFTGVKMNEDGTVAYDKDGNYQYTLDLPETLVHIGQYTFKNSGLVAIKIPQNVTALTSTYAKAKAAALNGDYNAISETFNGCTALESVIFEGKVTLVGKNAFNLCSSLEEVLAPDSEGNYTADGFFGGLKYVGDCAFKGTAIKRVKLDSAERFGKEIFMDSAVEEVYISQGIRYNNGKSDGWGASMFKNCVNLKGVKCDADGNPVVDADGSYTYTLVLPDNEYYFGPNTFENTGVKVVKFGSGVTTIGSSATNIKTYNGTKSTFMNCVDLEKVIFEGSAIKQICGSVFKGCTNLATVEGMKNVEYIGESAFEGCASLTSVTFEGAQLKTLGKKAFYECSNLATFNLPDSVTEIGEECFNGTAYSGDTLQLPKNLKTLGGKAFWGLDVTFSMADDSTNMKVVDGALYSKDGKTLYVVPQGFSGKLDLSGVTTIGSYAFAFADGITSITMPSKISKLNSYCFAYARMPEGFDVNALLKSLGNIALPQYAFQYAEGLGNVVLPEGIKMTATYVFNGSDIESVVIPSTLAAIPNSTFEGCTNLSAITFAKDVDGKTALTKINSKAFYGCGFSEFTIPSFITTIGTNAFEGCNLTELVFEKDKDGKTALTSIGSKAFFGCNIAKLNIPSSVTSIGESAFEGCNLTELVFEKDKDGKTALTTIGSRAFFEHSLAGTLEIPGSVTTIGRYAFAGKERTEVLDAEGNGTGEYDYTGCTTVTEIVLPSTYISMGEGTFANYYNLAKINLESIQKIYHSALSYAGILNDTGLELSFGALTYVGATVHTIDTDTGEITGLGKGPLGYANVAKITFLNEASVKGKLFHSFTALPEIVLPEGLTALPDYFYAYTFLKEITVPAFVETMGTNMFELSVYLTKITFEEGCKLTTIGNNAFASCPNLASLTLPETLESIGTWAFKADLSLKSVVLPKGTTLGAYATALWKADQTLYVRSPRSIAFGYLAYDFNHDKFGVIGNAKIVYGYEG